MTVGRTPRRTCLGCRQVRPKAELVRLVRRPDGTVRVDPRGPGRGAYVCPEEACIRQALKRGRLAQAFREPCEAGPGLAEEVRGAWQRRSR
ncbi:MAG TPA: YlxR family protein [Calidithermus sp.]|nr:YlxR family protein [Calidithermus sp.]